MHAAHRDTSIDSLRRNPTDGAYHCPRCDAPFTRRSNLRRHYHIHTRNTSHKCQGCSQIFAKSEELQTHSLQCGSNATSWDHASDRMIQAMAQYTTDGGIQHNIEFAGGLGIVGTPIHENPPGISDSFGHVDIFQQADQLKGHDQTAQELHDFFSSISPTLSEGSSSPSASSEIMSASSISFPFPYSATQHSGSSSSSGSPSPSSSTVFSNGYAVSPEERTRAIARWSKYNTMASSLDKGTPIDGPLYTRKQVEEMLDVVGSCFLNTIDAVLQRTQATDLPLGQEFPELQTLAGSHGVSMSSEARRMILAETIPRLMASLQTLRGDSFGTNHCVPP